MFDGILIALQTLVTPIGALFIFAGSFLGMVLGAIPGLSGGTLTMLIMPMIYSMDPALSMALLVGILVGSVSGGGIGSILLGIPGQGSSIVTVWDGYEFTKKGDPVRALSVCVVSNFIGTVPGLVIAMLLCPVLAQWAVKLGPWEYFGLCFCALAMIVGLSKGNTIKGLIAICFGALMGSMGVAPICGNLRMTFGISQFAGGVDLITCMLGLFATSRMLMEYTRQDKTEDSTNIKISKFRFPKKDILENKGNFIRSLITGLFIGFLPGLGSNVSTPLAYSNEKKRSKNPEEWGHGAIGGVIAPETANNAGIGGALIPMLSLGIPGDNTTAMFLAALTIQGVTCGPLLIQNNPDVYYSVFVGAIVAGIFVLLVQIFCMPIFPALLKIPYHYLYPAIITICFMGGYLSTGSMFSLYITLIFCLIGVAMQYFGIPQMPFMMGFILCELLETNLRQSLNFGNGWASYFDHPLALAFIVIGLIILIRQILEPIRGSGKKKANTN